MIYDWLTDDDDYWPDEGAASSCPTFEARKGKYKKPENPNKRKGADDRLKSGDREKNVGHPDGEEHSRIPKAPRFPR